MGLGALAALLHWPIDDRSLAGTCMALLAQWLAPDNVLALWTLVAFCR